MATFPDGRRARASASHWEGLSLVSGAATANTTGIGLVQPGDNHNAALSANSSFSHLAFYGADGYGAADYWDSGILVDNVSLVNFDDIDYTGTAQPYHGSAVYLHGKSDFSNGVQYQFANCTFTSYLHGIIYGNYLQGVVVANTNFQAGDVGIFIPAGQSIGPGNAQLNVMNSQFGEHKTAGIYMSSPVSPTLLSNNLFIITEVASYGAVLSGSYTTLHGNVFAGIGVSSTTGVTFASQSGSGVGVVTGNVFGALGTAVWLQNGSNKIAVRVNTCSGDVNTIIDNGTGNKVGSCP